MAFGGGSRHACVDVLRLVLLIAVAWDIVGCDDAVGSPPGITSISVVADVPSTDDRNCRLLGPFALITQALMGVVVVGSLVLKRQRERPKRPWKIWMLDISKQMLGQLFVHTLNVFLSWLGSRASAGEDNPCSLYFLNIAVDTTLGVLFIYYSMRFLTHYTTDVLAWPGFVSGQYYSPPAVLGRRKKRKVQLGPENGVEGSTSAAGNGANAGAGLERQSSALSNASNGGAGQQNRSSDKPRLSFFFKQLALYLLSLLLMKVMVVILFALFPFLYDIGRWVLDLFGQRKRAQILFVMAVFPLAMNTLQFWLIDSVLRHDPTTSKYKSEEGPYGVGHSTSTTGPTDVERGPHDDSLDAEYDAAMSGPWTTAWWTALFGGGDRSQPGSRRARGQYHQVDQHAIGDASSDEDDDEDERDEAHTYPPSASQSSSIAKIDEQDSKAVQRSSEEQRTGESNDRMSENAEDAEEEQEWDRWSDDGEMPVEEVPSASERKTHVD
jgi:hypothetical protein